MSPSVENPAENACTYMIWLKIVIWYPLNSLSWNVDVNPSKARYPIISITPNMEELLPACLDVTSPVMMNRLHPSVTAAATP